MAVEVEYAEQASDERETAEMSVADLMATLSQAEEHPEEITSVGPPFKATDVSFKDGSWRARLLDIEGWLRLDAALDESSPDALIRSLAKGLGEDYAEMRGDDAGSLSDLGLDLLWARLDAAATMQQLFQEGRESDLDMGAATAQWVESWEDQSGRVEDSPSDEPIIAVTDVRALSDFRSEALAGRLELSPSYQRGDVWPTSDAQLLIESILRGIPLPSVIFRIHQDTRGDWLEVVDGKQRLTAILRFTGAHPKAVERVRSTAAKHRDEALVALFEDDYPRFKRRWKQLTGQTLTATLEREYYFPFPLRKDASAGISSSLASLHGKYYTQIRDKVISVAKSNISVRKLFEQTCNYKIPVIEYEEAQPSQIHEVFHLYNKQGKHLNAEEIRNALFQELDLMRGLQVAAGDIEGPAVAAPFLVPHWDELRSMPTTLTGYGFGQLRFKRTKVLSWVTSIVFYESPGAPLSTAGHIDSFLGSVQTMKRHGLRDTARVVELFRVLAAAMDAHAGIVDVFDKSFVNAHNKKEQTATQKWQELQLVASLVGVTCATVALGDGIEDALADHAKQIAELSRSERWKRPKKTQTREQWKYIANVTMDLLEVLGVDVASTDTAITERFGASGLDRLARIAAGES